MSIHDILFSRSADLFMRIEDGYNLTQCYKNANWSIGTSKMKRFHEERLITKTRNNRLTNVKLTKKGKQVQDHLQKIAGILYQNRR